MKARKDRIVNYAKTIAHLFTQLEVDHVKLLEEHGSELELKRVRTALC